MTVDMDKWKSWPRERIIRLERLPFRGSTHHGGTTAQQSRNYPTIIHKNGGIHWRSEEGAKVRHLAIAGRKRGYPFSQKNEPACG
jgi:hypothetical protein